MSFNSNIFDYLKNKNFVPSKKMGQNFLVSDEYQKKIVDILDLKCDENILEIGPGFGSLTRWIWQKKVNLKLIELDKRLCDFLQKKYPSVKVINDDILKIDLNDYYLNVEKQKNKVISNLPYSISSKTIIKLVKSNLFDFCVFMVQKEMGERIIAKVGTKKYNNFTVLLNILCNIQKKFDVPSCVFVPTPKVISTVIVIKNNQNFDFNKVEQLEKFLKICFSQKRKTIFNNLKCYLSLEKINSVLNSCCVNKDARPEQISKENFLKMFEVYLSC